MDLGLKQVAGFENVFGRKRLPWRGSTLGIRPKEFQWRILIAAPPGCRARPRGKAAASFDLYLDSRDTITEEFSPVMKVVCAWCQKLLVEDAAKDAKISHGICEDCQRRMLGGSVRFGDFLDRLDFPVLVTDRNLQVVEANRAAATIAGSSRTRLKAGSTGMAIECYNAGLPGGCGQTPHCHGCALRKTIADTHADGQTRSAVYIVPQAPDGSRGKILQFRFFTQKVGDSVMVVIEETASVDRVGP
ncbi:MAG: hypothetical protein WC485_01780 [Opitutaceae bacterium]